MKERKKIRQISVLPERQVMVFLLFFFSSRRRHTRSLCDWSSDVCSSDLVRTPASCPRFVGLGRQNGGMTLVSVLQQPLVFGEQFGARHAEIGRASCRERV